VFPSADDATETHCKFGALVDCIHAFPEFVEVYIPLYPTATNLLPSAEEASPYQVPVCPEGIQVWAIAGLTAPKKLQRLIKNNFIRLIIP
jgi:hypothetical protein